LDRIWCYGMTFDEKKSPFLTGVGDLLSYCDLVFKILDVCDVYNGEGHLEYIHSLIDEKVFLLKLQGIDMQ
jgi:thymidine kinase